MVKTSRTAATQSSSSTRVKKKKPYQGTTIPKRINVVREAELQKDTLQKDTIEYRLVVFFNDVKHQGPRLCFKGAKLYKVLSIHNSFQNALDTLDLLVSTSTKTDQVSPNNKHKTIPLLGNKNSK